MESEIALITGLTGQDSSGPAEMLLSKGYEVHFPVRGWGSSNITNIKQPDRKPEISFKEGVKMMARPDPDKYDTR